MLNHSAKTSYEEQAIQMKEKQLNPLTNVTYTTWRFAVFFKPKELTYVCQPQDPLRVCLQRLL